MCSRNLKTKTHGTTECIPYKSPEELVLGDGHELSKCAQALSRLRMQRLWNISGVVSLKQGLINIDLLISKFKTTSNTFVSERCLLRREKNFQHFPHFSSVKLFDMEQRLSKGGRAEEFSRVFACVESWLNSGGGKKSLILLISLLKNYNWWVISFIPY